MTISYPLREEIMDWEEHRLATCRISGIRFSSLETPILVSLVVSDHAFDMIREILDQRPMITAIVPPGRQIEIPIEDVYALRRVCGKARGIDADYVIKSPLYDAAQAIYCLFEEWG
jgi:hypothetical protein